MFPTKTWQSWDTCHSVTEWWYNCTSAWSLRHWPNMVFIDHAVSRSDARPWTDHFPLPSAGSLQSDASDNDLQLPNHRYCAIIVPLRRTDAAVSAGIVFVTTFMYARVYLCFIWISGRTGAGAGPIALGVDSALSAPSVWRAARRVLCRMRPGRRPAVSVCPARRPLQSPCRTAAVPPVPRTTLTTCARRRPCGPSWRTTGDCAPLSTSRPPASPTSTPGWRWDGAGRAENWRSRVTRASSAAEMVGGRWESVARLAGALVIRVCVCLCLYLCVCLRLSCVLCLWHSLSFCVCICVCVCVSVIFVFVFCVFVCFCVFMFVFVSLSVPVRLCLCAYVRVFCPLFTGWPKKRSQLCAGIFKKSL